MSTVTGGGVERRRLSLAKYLNKGIFQMKLVGTYKGGNIAEQIEENGVEIIEIGGFKGPFHWEKHKRVQKIIDDFQPHIVHGAVYEGNTLAAINGFLKKVPIVLLEETSNPKNRSTKASFLLKVFSMVSDFFIAIAPNVANYLTEKAGVSSKKVIIINNGVEIPREVSIEEVEKLKQTYKIGKDDFVIGSVGRLFNDVKRVTDLLEATAILNNPKLKLLIVGGGPDEGIIRQKAIDLQIIGNVIFTGYNFDTAPFYNLMDLFCIVSSHEGFGLVAAEAMLNRLPVIATKVGGLQDIVVDQETGFLIPPYSPKMISEKIQYLIDHPKYRKSIGEKGYQRAMLHYTAERYCKEVEDLYLDLLKKKGIIE